MTTVSTTAVVLGAGSTLRAVCEGSLAVPGPPYIPARDALRVAAFVPPGVEDDAPPDDEPAADA
jgi:hypothetical protein